jgi:PAS domain S-box-containing protein
VTPSISSETIWPDLLERLRRDPGMSAFVRDGAAVLVLPPDGGMMHANVEGQGLAAGGIPAPTMQRLKALADGLAPRAGVRLERLLFATPAGERQFTAACQRLGDPQHSGWLLIAIPEAGAAPAPPAIKTQAAPASEAAQASKPTAEPLPAKVRFLWELTPDGLIGNVSPEAAVVFGQQRVEAIVGRHWSALCGPVVHDPDGQVAAALAGRNTWSGKSSLWREGDSDKAFRVTLSGLPLIDRPSISDNQRILTGWRGFGVVDTTTRHDFPALQSAEPALAENVSENVAENLSPATPQKSEPAADGRPPLHEAQDDAPAPAPRPVPPSNVVAIRPHDAAPKLTTSERNAFREIAKALGARVDNEVVHTAETPEETVPPVLTAASVPDAAPPETTSTIHRIVTAMPPQAPGEDMFASLLDKLPIGVLVLKAERMVYANRTLLDLLDHDSLDDLLDVGTGRLFRGAAPSEGGGVFTLMRRDGSLEPVDARLSAIAWNGESATLMSFRRALEQVDAQRLEAMKLDVAKARGEARELSAILDTATDGVATLDERGRILSLNKSAEALFGYDQREVAGENFTLLLAPESHITALDYLEGLKGGGVAALLNDGREVQGRVRQGGRIPLYMTMGRVADEPERKYSAVLRDLTAWKKAEADLVDARKLAEQASAQKSDVLAKISHEIRTPLNAIIGFTEVMSEERFGPIANERYKEYLGDIHQSGAYLISLINDLLDLAKIEAGKMDLTFTGVNLNDIAGAAVALLQPEANRQRVVLRTGLQARLPSVVADERSLRQIIINVLSNAVKFTDAGGQVILSTALGDRGEVIIRVRDTGIGMTEKELALAMEPFRQISATRRPSSGATGGTGLGLPITKALVEANKGAIQITSAKNEGTLVEIMFPPQRVLAS